MAGAGVPAPGPPPEPQRQRHPDPALPRPDSLQLAPSPRGDPGPTSRREKKRGRMRRRQLCPRYLRVAHATAVTTIASWPVPFLVTAAAAAEQLTLTTTNYSPPRSPPRARGRPPSPPASPPASSQPRAPPSARALAVALREERARARVQALEPLPCRASVPQEESPLGPSYSGSYPNRMRHGGLLNG